MSAGRPARTGDELAEVACRCGRVYVRRSARNTWRCGDCGRSGSLIRLCILGPSGAEPVTDLGAQGEEPASAATEGGLFAGEDVAS